MNKIILNYIKNPSVCKLRALIKNIDNLYLIEDYNYSGDLGLLENDFRNIINNPNKSTSEKTKIVFAIINNANFKYWVLKYKSVFYDIIEKSIIEGDYEKYGIKDEHVLSSAFKNKLITKKNFLEDSIFRGYYVGNKYRNKSDLVKLTIIKSINYIKVCWYSIVFKVMRFFQD